MRPLLIGQAPGPKGDASLPLFPLPKHCAGGRLAELMGVSFLTYLRCFDRVNLLPYFPGSNDGGDKFPMKPTKMAAAIIAPLLAERTVVLVGRGVADAFDFKQPLPHLGEGPGQAWLRFQPRGLSDRGDSTPLRPN